MKILSFLIISIFLTGCYTVVWLPDKEMPTTYVQDEFYDSEYFGDYYEYYIIPWWISNPINIYKPSQSFNKIKERERNSSNIRNEVGERIIFERGNSGTTEYNPPITTKSGNNNNSNSQTNSGSRINSTSENSNRNNSNSGNNSNSIRNENGNRNSENPRR
ncbi:MAG: hypothetical protein NZM09_11405 [Ignavibacterium sp.]|nr:hypothetical protein [Ignavibacterium sp.]MCX7611894.1 hypothetical protein [Ignavibacterium sp.]MDW8376284.1 hypothetical protein [Ignavibacteriales bacterium]